MLSYEGESMSSKAVYRLTHPDNNPIAVRLIEDDPETVAAIGEFLDCCRENGWTVTQDKIATVFGPAVQVTEWEPVDDDE
jgi:hypothetical protein